MKAATKGSFSGGPVFKILPANGGDMGLIPGQRTKIPHAAGQLSHNIGSLMPQVRPDAAKQINEYIFKKL